MALVGVGGGRAGLDELRGFVRSYNVGNFPHIADVSGEAWAEFGVTYQPWWAIIRKDGSVEKGGGFFPSHIVEEALRS